MTAGPAGVALVVFALGYALSPPESSDPGHRVESNSYSSPTVIARCITYNINRKRPELVVRNRRSDSDDGSIYLVLNISDQNPALFGVIRIEQGTDGSRLTTWLPQKSLADVSPSEIAQKLIAGC